MTVNWVDVFIISMIAIIFIVDGFIFKNKGEPGTISFRIAQWTQKEPIIALLFGILLGHLFYPNRGYCP